MSNKKNLNLLIRGESFRIGGHTSRSTNGSIPEQKNAVMSIIKYIIQPLNKFFNLNIYIDISCSSFEKKKLIYNWFKDTRNIKKFIIRDSVAYGQLNSIRRALNIIDNKIFSLFMIRIDCVFKMSIPFNRLNFDSFYAPSLGCECHNYNTPGINEIFIFIPRFKLKFFLNILNHLVGNCHDLYNVIRKKTNFKKNNLRFIVKHCYRSGTNRHWNPLFYLTARNIAKKNKKDKNLEFDL